MQTTKFRSLVISSATLALFGLVTTEVAAQTGTISGRVTAAGGAAGPLEAARVTVVGTNLGASTNRDGVYTIRGVPPGSWTVRVIRLGYAQGQQTVTVASTQTATLDFVLTEAPFTLEEITTTATGEARKLEVGNTIHTIQVAPLVENGPVRDLGQILAARAPGVAVLPSSGTIGTGTRIRIRGSNSVSLSNEPLFIIDGIRVNTGNGDQGFNVGGQGASRLLDINPEEIADIQVLKGPSASAVYGTGGSNGVVLITTKRGVAGKARWNVWSEVGVNEDNASYPDNYFPATSTGGRCNLWQQALGTCTISAVKRFNPLRNDSTSPLQNGIRQQYGASVSGGTDAVQYFVSGEWEGDQGIYELNGKEQDRLLAESGRASLRTEETTPNWRSKYNIRANTNFILNPKTTGGVSIGYVSNEIRLPQDDNNVLGIHSSALNGDGRGGEDPNRVWGFFAPGETFQRLTVQHIDRFTISANGTYNPFTWLTGRATIGVDLTERQDQQVQRLSEGPNFGTQRTGFAGEARVKQSVYTVDLGGTANFRLTDRLTSKTSGGFQYTENNTHGTNGNGDGLPPGTVTVTATSIKRLTEGTTIFKSAGGYFDEVLGIDERLFLTGSVRFDKNSSTGFQAKTITYPKAAISYLTPWFNSGTFSSLRLRGSFGEAGQQPTGTTALLTFFATQGRLNGADVPGFGLNNFGDPKLKAERSTEFEAGFDLGLFDGKYQVEFSAFTKDTKDALIFVPTPSSLGTPAGQFRNAGRVRNQGLELVVNGQVINHENLTWDFTATGTLERNQLRNLPEGIPPINANGTTQQHRECLPNGGRCYPLGGYWGRKITFNDADGNKILTPSEVTVGDTLEFVGNSQPTRLATFNTTVGLFKGRIQVSSTLDYHGGNKLWNLQEEFRCATISNCKPLSVETSLDRQAAVIARTQFGAKNTNRGFIEDAEFLKWREASITYNAPASWARLIRAERLSFTATGRNLGTLTGYDGLDPEVNGQGEANFAVREFLSVPPLRQFAFRVNLTF